ncbi:hypothetical protein, partial [Herbiconiux daphne]
VFSDTDSVKIQYAERHTKLFDDYNESNKKKLLFITGYYGIDEQLLHPKTVEGVEKWLGVWDFDGSYKLFKTLGAKKYIYSVEGSEQVYITVAGLGKVKGAEFINQLADTAREKMEKFAYGLFIPEKFTGKLLRHKTTPNTFKIQDYMKKIRKVNDIGGTHLSPTTFEIGEISLIKLAFGDQIKVWERLFGTWEEMKNER